MNPYTPPSAVPDATDPARGHPPVQRGMTCVKCGSTNTRPETALKSKPSIIAVIFLGWWFLLIRSAFAKRTELCHDCGATWRHKTTGSWLALTFLLLLAALVTLGLFVDAD